MEGDGGITLEEIEGEVGKEREGWIVEGCHFTASYTISLRDGVLVVDDQARALSRSGYTISDVRALAEMRGLLTAASRYVQGFHESERNHPQARDGAWNLLQSIKAALED